MKALFTDWPLLREAGLCLESSIDLHNFYARLSFFFTAEFSPVYPNHFYRLQHSGFGNAYRCFLSSMHCLNRFFFFFQSVPAGTFPTSSVDSLPSHLSDPALLFPDQICIAQNPKHWPHRPDTPHFLYNLSDSDPCRSKASEKAFMLSQAFPLPPPRHTLFDRDGF